MGIDFSSGFVQGVHEEAADFSGNSGIKLGSNATQTKIRKYTSSSTYNPTSGTKYIEVHCIGGGGGTKSGTEVSGDEANDPRSTGGGGGGGYCIGNYTLLSENFEASITVGEGGEGGQGHSTQVRAGEDGGFSRFETTVGSSHFNTNGGAARQTANGGEGVGTNAEKGSGGGAEGTLEFHGEEGRDEGFQGGYGGNSGHSDRTYGRGGNGWAQENSNQINGNAGTDGYVYIIEYIE